MHRHLEDYVRKTIFNMQLMFHIIRVPLTIHEVSLQTFFSDRGGLCFCC